MAVPCCAPLGLLLVNCGRLTATKLGQSLRSSGSQRRRQHDQRARRYGSVRLHSDNTRTLSWRKARRAKIEMCIVLTEKTRISVYSQAGSFVKLYFGTVWCFELNVSVRMLTCSQ